MLLVVAIRAYKTSSRRITSYNRVLSKGIDGWMLLYHYYYSIIIVTETKPGHKPKRELGHS